MGQLDDDTIALTEAGDLDALRALLSENPAIVRDRNAGGETLLHIAARQWPKLPNGEAIARALLDAGADVDAADQDGLRPIQGATGDIALTRVLLEAGAETAIYSSGHMNMGPAEVALYYGLPDEARLMVAHGAAVDLRVAAGIGDLEAVRGFVGPDGQFRDDAVGLPGQPAAKVSKAARASSGRSSASKA